MAIVQQSSKMHQNSEIQQNSAVQQSNVDANAHKESFFAVVSALAKFIEHTDSQIPLKSDASEGTLQ